MTVTIKARPEHEGVVEDPSHDGQHLPLPPRQQPLPATTRCGETSRRNIALRNRYLIFVYCRKYLMSIDRKLRTDLKSFPIFHIFIFDAHSNTHRGRAVSRQPGNARLRSSMLALYLM